MALFTCMGGDGTCRPTARPMSDGAAAPLPPRPDEDGPIVLAAPVGEGYTAKNRLDDVAKVQRGFNRLLPEDRGFLAPLKVDGICGPKTRGAIQAFQTKYFGARQADKLMEPGRQTVSKLNELIKTRGFSPATIEDVARLLGLPLASVTDSIAQSFALAERWVSATSLQLIVPQPSALLQKYFRIEQQAQPARAAAQVRLIFQRLKTVLGRPGGLWGQASFEPEPAVRVTDTIAWTTPGGFFMGGQTGFIPVPDDQHLIPIRMDSIYYTPRFVMKTIPQRAYVIVHELCHYVSSSPEIRDHVYAHKDWPGFEALPADKRLSNTDHYTMLAYETGTGEARPPLGL